jgi:hypothetical protein
MNRLTERVTAHHEALDGCPKEAGILQKRWQQATGELNRLDAEGSQGG